MLKVEEIPSDDPYYGGFVTSCIVCHEGLVLVLPNYLESETYSSCNNPLCSIHDSEGPTV